MTNPIWLKDDGSIDIRKFKSMDDQIDALAVSLASIERDSSSAQMAIISTLLARLVIMAGYSRAQFLEKVSAIYDLEAEE